ncbi:MAG: hypothetical protein D6689_21765 [Deltaproteobacteria bacterium]|nr:MAG: hypothetical protein D6689_21765 [Deltaproteobacteria bacterium]
MRRPHLHVWAILAIAGLAFAPAGARADRTKRRPSGCAEASRVSVDLPGRAAVDEIRVIVAPDSPESSAARISVGAGVYDRTIRVLGGGSRGLKFTSPLVGSRFSIELDPVFEAPRSACVERVLLLRDGALIAAVTP